jgi:hypothetical protein
MTGEFTFCQHADARCVWRHHRARGLHVSNPLDQQIALGKHLVHGLPLFCSAPRHAAKAAHRDQRSGRQRKSRGWARHNGGRKRAHEQDPGSAEVLRCAGKGPARIVKLRLDSHWKSIASAWRLLEVPAHDLSPAGRGTGADLTRWNVVAIVHVR